jgi:hypothetical protein
MVMPAGGGSDPVVSVRPERIPPAKVQQELRSLLGSNGKLILPNGHQPRTVLRKYPPRYLLRLFDTTFYLSRVLQNEDIRFFFAYLSQARAPNKVFARLFYKDVSLIWRCASHYASFDTGVWIGKGAVSTVVDKGVQYLESIESTTDLPLEMQTALEAFSHRLKIIPYDEQAITIALRRAPRQRIEPYRDFIQPRLRAAQDPTKLPNKGRPLARFRRNNDPTSLRFTPGFEPDFSTGVWERAELTSSLYGGDVTRYRILSSNRLIQFSLVASKRHYFVAAVQSVDQRLSSFGVRVVDAVVDERLLLPGYDYHFLDDETDPPQLHSQIPVGFAGAPSPNDPSRADTSKWLNNVPMLKEFARRHRRGRLMPDSG